MMRVQEDDLLADGDHGTCPLLTSYGLCCVYDTILGDHELCLRLDYSTADWSLREYLPPGRGRQLKYRQRALAPFKPVMQQTRPAWCFRCYQFCIDAASSVKVSIDKRVVIVQLPPHCHGKASNLASSNC